MLQNGLIFYFYVYVNMFVLCKDYVIIYCNVVYIVNIVDFYTTESRLLEPPITRTCFNSN